MIVDVIVAILVISGALLALTAAIGLVRFPDTLARMHAATKPQTLGLLFFMVAAMVKLGGAAIGMLVLTCLFALITAPVVGHRVGRLAYQEQRHRDQLIEPTEMESGNTPY